MAAGEFSRLLLSHWRELSEKLRSQDEAIIVDGRSLSLAAVVACARYEHAVVIGEETSEAVRKNTERVFGQLRDSEAISGEFLELCKSLKLLMNSGSQSSWRSSIPDRVLAIEHLQLSVIRDANSCILSGETDFDNSHANQNFSAAIPLSDPIESTSMPESWARATLLIRANTLAYPSSGIRPVVLERLAQLLNFDVIPRVPLRGSNSGSGDFFPLGYIAGVLQGKPSVQAWIGDRIQGGRRLVPADEALNYAEIDAVEFRAKDGLAVTVGTAPSSGIACLALHEAMCLAATCTVLTAMSAEALCASSGAFHPLFGELRAHPGQKECAMNIRGFIQGSKLSIEDSTSTEFGHRTDGYAIRTSPQWIGPILEDLQLAHRQISIEINSAVDNPLIETSGKILYGGNFQAKSVASAMEKVRQNCQSLGQMLFAQCTELINPAFNRGLPAHLVVDEPSQSALFKGTDIMISALQSELGFLSNSVGTHVQFAEAGHQAINSLALVSARYALTSVDVLTQLAAVHLVSVCQALDLRAMHIQFLYTLAPKFKALTRQCLGECNVTPQLSRQGSGNGSEVAYELWVQLSEHMNRTMHMDSSQRFEFAMDHLQTRLLKEVPSTQQSLERVQQWHNDCVHEASQTYQTVQTRYLATPDATPILGKAAKRIYKFLRKKLEIPFVGNDYLASAEWDDGTSHEDKYKYHSMGAMNSAVYEAMRNGALYSEVVDCFDDV